MWIFGFWEFYVVVDLGFWFKLGVCCYCYVMKVFVVMLDYDLVSSLGFSVFLLVWRWYKNCFYWVEVYILVMKIVIIIFCICVWIYVV